MRTKGNSYKFSEEVFGAEISRLRESNERLLGALKSTRARIFMLEGWSEECEKADSAIRTGGESE